MVVQMEVPNLCWRLAYGDYGRGLAIREIEAEFRLPGMRELYLYLKHGFEPSVEVFDELAFNQALHGWGGVLCLSRFSDQGSFGIEVTSLDEGPGIRHFESILRESRAARARKRRRPSEIIDKMGSARVFEYPDTFEMESSGFCWTKVNGDLRVAEGGRILHRGCYIRTTWNLSEEDYARVVPE